METVEEPRHIGEWERRGSFALRKASVVSAVDIL